jgi:uncharacterized protein YbjT (DUF2867 family)
MQRASVREGHETLRCNCRFAGMTKHVVLGATGHVGSAVAQLLLSRHEDVIAVVHDEARAGPLREQGAEIAVADVRDSDALREIFRRADRAFLLNPPAAPDTDTDVEEGRTVASIVTALEYAGLEKVVAASTYGARPGEAIGDLSILHAFERGLAAQPIPVAINRAAYYFTNWDSSLETAKREGVVRTPYPADFVLPMVDPEDIGAAAVRRLLSNTDDVGLRYIEGPARYTPQDVADTFAALLERPVRVETVPRDTISSMFESLGFSPPAARSYARMTTVTLDAPCRPETPERGTVTLRNYLARLVDRSA